MHHHGAKLAINMGVGGMGRNDSFATPENWPIAPSEISCYWYPDILTRELTIKECEEIMEDFGKSVGICKRAGVDAIEIVGYGGYFADMLSTGLWNKRTDRYGGNLDGRLRFSMELIKSCQKYNGEDYPIIYKFSPVYFIEGGRKLEEGKKVATRLEAADIAALNVAPGCYESMDRVYPSEYEPSGTMLEIAEAIKKVVKIPVLHSGKLGVPQFAEWALQQGKVDIIGLDRTLLADQDGTKKVKEGRLNDIRPCIGCQDGCYGPMFPFFA